MQTKNILKDNYIHEDNDNKTSVNICKNEGHCFYKKVVFLTSFFKGIEIKLVMLGMLIICSSVFFESLYILDPFFNKIMSVSAYLSWHTIFEFMSILVSFCIFILYYYSYRQKPILKGIIIANVFLIMGLIDTYHTLSFKGMPYFFIENATANRATTFWIIARLIGAIGITIGGLIKSDKISKIDRRIYLILSVGISVAIMILVTYYPGIIPVMFIEGKGVTPVKKYLEYIIVFFLFFAGCTFLYKYIKKKDGSNYLFSIAITTSIFSELAFVRYISVYDIYNYIGHIYKIISYYIIFRIAFISSIEKPYLELYKAKKKLKEYAGNLNKLVDERTKELNQINQKLLEDLEYAKDIQKAMLPDLLPDSKEVRFDARYYPAEMVSGDFYNIFKLDEDTIGMYIGDVSGHGVPAAMLTVFLNQSIKTTREISENQREIINSSTVLDNLYETYNKVNFKNEMYILVLYAIYNIETKELTYSSAGLNVQPLIIRNKEIKELEIRGLPICNLIDICSGDYKEWTLQLYKKDKVFFYTDGLTQLKNNRTGEVFDENYLKGLLLKYCDEDIGEINQKIEETIKSFTKDNDLGDDITFFILEAN